MLSLLYFLEKNLLFKKQKPNEFKISKVMKDIIIHENKYI